MTSGKSARLGAPAIAALAVFAALLFTTDERSFGVMPDGKEMLSASAAIARHLEIGVSRDFVNAVPRKGGDAVSRYGLGSSLVDAVPTTAARLLHAVAPRALSPTLFVLGRVLLLTLAAWACAAGARALGASRLLAALSGVVLVLGTHAWGYAGSDLSEPLQLAAVSLLAAATAVLRHPPLEGGVTDVREATTPGLAPPRARQDPRRWEAAAGIAAGAALLAKSLLVVVAVPLLLAAMLPVARAIETGRKRARAAAAAPRFRIAVFFAPLAALWLLFELVRFGTLFGGYPGETFTYPPLTGLLRLTLLPNKGLLFYAPVVFLAPLGFARLLRRDRALAFALGGAAAAIVAAASAWWAWDGQAGWGPRLLVPALPPLVLLAAAAAAEGGAALRAVAAIASAAGLGVNALGALVPFPQVYALVSTAPARPISASRAAGTPYEIETRPDGTLAASAPHHLSLTPSWSPIRVHARVLLAKLRGGDVGARLAALDGFTPELSPRIPDAPSPALRAAIAPFRWPFLGRALLAPLPGTVDPDREALRDQTVRALDVARYDRALAHATELLRAAPDDVEALALGAEAAIRARRRAESEALLARAGGACHPWLLYVRYESGAADFTCVPEPDRSGLAANVEAALAARATVSQWARAARGASP